MGNLLVAINKENFVSANCVYFGRADLLYAISLAKGMLDNYNANLVNSGLNDVPLAIRMLQRENKDATRRIYQRPWIGKNSKEYLEDRFPMFKPDGSGIIQYDSLSRLAVSNSDKISNLQDETMSIEINLTGRYVQFLNCYTVRTKHGWAKDHTDEEFRNLKVSEYNFKNIPFNDLEDVFYFVQNNPKGWLSSSAIYANQVLVPLQLS